MDKRLELAYTKISECLVCFQRNSRTLGIRGNREYTGANPNAFPHLHTQVVECRNCGFIYTDPQIFGVEFLEEEYYNQPDGYQVNSDDALNEMYTERIRFIRKFKTSGELLDIGAGKGYFVRVAKLSGFTAVGIEPSPKICDFAKKN